MKRIRKSPDEINHLKAVVLPGVTLTSFEMPDGNGPDPRRKIKLRLMTTDPDAGLMCDLLRDPDYEVFITVRPRTNSNSSSIPHNPNPNL
jgi:hypothetical protein